MTPCRKCASAPGEITPYWAKDGHKLCRPCCIYVAEELDRRDKWPPVPWTSDDEEVLS
jgi:hypothetical protein